VALLFAGVAWWCDERASGLMIETLQVWLPVWHCHTTTLGIGQAVHTLVPLVSEWYHLVVV